MKTLLLALTFLVLLSSALQASHSFKATHYKATLLSQDRNLAILMIEQKALKTGEALYSFYSCNTTDYVVAWVREKESQRLDLNGCENIQNRVFTRSDFISAMNMEKESNVLAYSAITVAAGLAVLIAADVVMTKYMYKPVAVPLTSILGELALGSALLAVIGGTLGLPEKIVNKEPLTQGILTHNLKLLTTKPGELRDILDFQLGLLVDEKR